jgi:hypothetical protein
MNTRIASLLRFLYIIRTNKRWPNHTCKYIVLPLLILKSLICLQLTSTHLSKHVTACIEWATNIEVQQWINTFITPSHCVYAIINTTPKHTQSKHNFRKQLLDNVYIGSIGGKDQRKNNNKGRELQARLHEHVSISTSADPPLTTSIAYTTWRSKGFHNYTCIPILITDGPSTLAAEAALQVIINPALNGLDSFLDSRLHNNAYQHLALHHSSTRRRNYKRSIKLKFTRFTTFRPEQLNHYQPQTYISLLNLLEDLHAQKHPFFPPFGPQPPMKIKIETIGFWTPTNWTQLIWKFGDSATMLHK